MSNPMLNDDAIRRARASWPAPDASTRAEPVTDGPISPWTRGEAMTVGGTISATGVLLALLLVSGAAGWIATKANESGSLQFPAAAYVGVIIGAACVIALWFKPAWARVLAPVYALAEGFFVGAISKAYETSQNGIVLQAVGATVAVFAVMLVLYRTRILKVTDRFRRIIITATLGLMAFYLVCLVIRLFAGADSISFLQSPSLLGIAFSVFAAGLAAMNLALDFDFIERGERQQLPKQWEWYGAFATLVTLVWLYLELLRLLSKLNRR